MIHSNSVNEKSNLEIETRPTTKKLSTKSRSYWGNTTKVQVPRPLEVVQPYGVYAAPVRDLTPFEHFLLASTPYIVQILETDNLFSIFGWLETISDSGVELYYKNNDESQTNYWDVYLPTVKGASLMYKQNFSSMTLDSYNYTEEEPLYNRIPFIDKIQELSCEENSPFSVPLPQIASNSWLAIEWFQHFSNNNWSGGNQSSITVYYSLDFTKANSYLPILNWEISGFGENLTDIYKATAYPYSSYSTFDVNSLFCK